MAERVVVIGAGQAAGQLALSLRKDGFDGAIAILGEEPYLPYQRPPLSKAYLAGELTLDRMILKPESFYAEEAIEMRLGVRASAIDRAARRVETQAGERIPYDRLVLATGSRVCRLPCARDGMEGLHYIRTIDDIEAMKPGFVAGARLVVVGAGYIGLEVAAVAAKRGLEVTVVELADRVLARVAAPVMSAFFERVHREAGVRLELGACVEAVEGTRRAVGVRLADGRLLPCDLVVVGIGILPAGEDLARAAGLDCEDGIVVDAATRTSDPAILAVGDCTRHPNALYGRRLRLESVQNAIDQAKAAAALLCGHPAVYSEVPWFWSDQYELKLQIAGLSEGYDRVVTRGKPESRAFAAFYFAMGKLIAVEAVNRPAEYMLGRRAIAAGARPDPARLADETIPIKELL